MLETFQHFIQNYGYLAIVLGCILEGELCLFLGLFIAQQGLLGYPGVFSAALLGTLISDVGFYYGGRHIGQKALAKRGRRWRARCRLAQRLIHHRGALVLVGFRFALGLRSIAPFIFGSIGVRQVQFLFFSGIGAVLWLILYGILGITLSTTIQATIHSVKTIEKVVLGLFILAGAIAAFYIWWRQHKSY